MTISKDQKDKLKSLGFKARGKESFSLLSSSNQFIRINILENNFQLAVDGTRIYGTKLSFEDVFKIVTILYPNESRQILKKILIKNSF